jgi:hypothetical protein
MNEESAAKIIQQKYRQYSSQKKGSNDEHNNNKDHVEGQDLQSNDGETLLKIRVRPDFIILAGASMRENVNEQQAV